MQNKTPFYPTTHLFINNSFHVDMNIIFAAGPYSKGFCIYCTCWSSQKECLWFKIYFWECVCYMRHLFMWHNQIMPITGILLSHIPLFPFSSQGISLPLFFLLTNLYLFCPVLTPFANMNKLLTEANRLSCQLTKETLIAESEAMNFCVTDDSDSYNVWRALSVFLMLTDGPIQLTPLHSCARLQIWVKLHNCCSCGSSATGVWRGNNEIHWHAITSLQWTSVSLARC